MEVTTDILINAIKLIGQNSNRELTGITIYGSNGKVFSVQFKDSNKWENATIEDGKVVISNK